MAIELTELGIDVDDVVKEELTEQDTNIVNHINEKTGSFVTELKNDIKQKGYDLEIKINIAFSPSLEKESKD